MSCALSLSTNAAIMCLCWLFPSLILKNKNKPPGLAECFKLACHGLILLIYSLVFNCKLSGYVMGTMSWVFRKLMRGKSVRFHVCLVPGQLFLPHFIIECSHVVVGSEVSLHVCEACFVCKCKYYLNIFLMFEEKYFWYF